MEVDINMIVSELFVQLITKSTLNQGVSIERNDGLTTVEY